MNVPLDLKLKVSAYMEYYLSNELRDHDLEQEVIQKLDQNI